MGVGKVGSTHAGSCSAPAALILIRREGNVFFPPCFSQLLIVARTLRTDHDCGSAGPAALIVRESFQESYIVWGQSSTHFRTFLIGSASNWIFSTRYCSLAWEQLWQSIKKNIDFNMRMIWSSCLNEIPRYNNPFPHYIELIRVIFSNLVLCFEINIVPFQRQTGSCRF